MTLDRYRPERIVEEVSVITPLCKFCGNPIAAGQRMHAWCARVVACGKRFMAGLNHKYVQKLERLSKKFAQKDSNETPNQ